MDENLIGYLLGSLDDDTRRQVEDYLEANPDARQRLELLEQALAPLAEDRDSVRTPPRLAERTLCFVAERTIDDLPRLPASPASSGAGVGVALWRRMDVFVAACLLVAVMGMAGPALMKIRSQQSRVECQNNLRRFHAALAGYKQEHGSFPDLTKNAPHEAAGMIVPLLRDAGTLPQDASVICPGDKSPALSTNDSLEELASLDADQFGARAPKLMPCYAYSLGYRDEKGYHNVNEARRGACHVAAAADASQIPLMADRPPSGYVGNSPNHGGRGQNVLFQDGNVRFLPVRSFASDHDIYLNKRLQAAAGICPDDFALGTSSTRP